MEGKSFDKKRPEGPFSLDVVTIFHLQLPRRGFARA